jgi:hypothetical protein
MIYHVHISIYLENVSHDDSLTSHQYVPTLKEFASSAHNSSFYSDLQKPTEQAKEQVS